MSIGTLVDSIRLSGRQIPRDVLSQTGMHVIELQKARIRYLDTGGSGRPVVIAPDPPNTVEHHLAMVEKLRENHRVIVFDLPGFGFSYPRLGFSFDLTDQRDAITELFDALNVKNATLVFSCLASFAALGVALERPDRVADLVLAQVPSFEDGSKWARRLDEKRVLRTPVLGQLMMAVNGTKVARGWYRAALPKGVGIGEFFEPAKRVLSGGGCYCLASAFQRFHHSKTALFTGIAQPVSVFWGAADRTHRKSNPEGILDHVPHAQIRILEHCGHFPDLEYTADVISAIGP